MDRYTASLALLEGAKVKHFVCEEAAHDAEWLEAEAEVTELSSATTKPTEKNISLEFYRCQRSGCSSLKI